MPAKTEKQAKYMRMCAHTNKKGCPPKKVAREFMHTKNALKSIGK